MTCAAIAAHPRTSVQQRLTVWTTLLWLAVAMGSFLTLAPPVTGQDDTAQEVPAKEDVPVQSQQDEPGENAAATPGPAAAAFEAKFAQWKALIVQLRQLRSDFQTKITGAERAAMAQKWDKTVAQAEAMFPELVDTVIAAYAEESPKDRVKMNFLIKALHDYAERDMYEPALKIGAALIDNGCENSEVFGDTGSAAFAMNDYDRAISLLDKAAELNALAGTAAQMRATIAEYQKYWEQEQQLRAKEADADDLPRVKISTTKGDLVVELFENEAPETVANFISLVKRGFYSDLAFHRVIGGFMAQGGCPEGDGTGGPGYRIYDECNRPDYRRHFRGVLSMAKTNAPNSGGSQFFINFRPTPNLDGKHTVFGRVIEGIDVLPQLTRTDQAEDDAKPVPDRILEATVLRDRGHEYVPHKVE